MDKAETEEEALENLKNNDFFPKITFDAFLEKKKKGKRLFYLKPSKNQEVELFQEYQRQIQER